MKFNTFARNFVSEIMPALDLDPKTYPGVAEVLRYSAHFVAKDLAGLSKEDIEESIGYVKNSLKFEVDMIRDFSGDFYESPADVPEEIYCALIGGADLIPGRWTHPSVKAAKKLVENNNYFDHEDPDMFEIASTAEKYYFMLDILRDLCAGHAQMTQHPEHMSVQKCLAIGSTVADAQDWHPYFPDCKLKDVIVESMNRVAPILNKCWNDVKTSAPQPIMAAL